MEEVLLPGREVEALALVVEVLALVEEVLAWVVEVQLPSVQPQRIGLVAPCLLGYSWPADAQRHCRDGLLSNPS